MAAPRTVRIKVVDQDNQPWPLLSVNLKSLPGSTNTVNLFADTDANGIATFTYTVPDNSRDVLQATAATGAGTPLVLSTIRYNDDPPPPAPTALTLTRDPATASPVVTRGGTASFRGRVLDQYGAPVAGVSVNVFVTDSLNTFVQSTQTTNALGEVVFSYSNGTTKAHSVRLVLASDATRTSNDVPVYWADPVGPALLVNASPVLVGATTTPGSFSLTARLEVIDNYGKPLQGITVNRAKGPGVLATQTAVTDSNGLATFTWSETNEAQQYFWVGGGTYDAQTNIALKSTSQVRKVRAYRIVPTQAAVVGKAGYALTIQARVLTGDTGTPVSGETVSFSAAPGGVLPSRTAVTDANGYATHTYPGTEVVQGNTSFTITTNEANTAAAIEVITANRTPRLTEDDNRYTDVQAGNPARTVRIKVADQDGLAWVGASITLQSQPGSAHTVNQTVLTDAAGIAAFSYPTTTVAPGGAPKEDTLTATMSGYTGAATVVTTTRYNTDPPPPPPPRAAVVVWPAQATRIRQNQYTGSFVIRVIDQYGNPLPSKQVFVSRQGANPAAETAVAGLTNGAGEISWPGYTPANFGADEVIARVEDAGDADARGALSVVVEEAPKAFVVRLDDPAPTQTTDGSYVPISGTVLDQYNVPINGVVAVLRVTGTNSGFKVAHQTENGGRFSYGYNANYVGADVAEVRVEDPPASQSARAEKLVTIKEGLETLTRIHQLTAGIAAKLTKTHDLNALTARVTLKTHNLNASVKGPLSKTHAIDAITRLPLTGISTHRLDLVILGPTTISAAIDGVVARRIVKTHSLGALVARPANRTHNLIAGLSGFSTQAHSLDAVVMSTLPALTWVRAYMMDVRLQGTLKQEHALDAVTQIPLTAIHRIDAVKRSALTTTHSVDAVKRATFERTHNVNGLLRATFAVSAGVDASTYLRLTKTHNIDAVRMLTTTKTHRIDASTFYKGIIKTHSLDASRFLRLTKTHNLDAIRRATFVKTHSLDARTLWVQTKTHSLDARRVLTPIKTHSLNASVKGSRTPLHFLDAYLSEPATGLYHEFTLGGVTYRANTVDSFEDVVETPGGFISAAGRISQEEYDANKATLKAGATWRVWDAGTGKCVFAGELRDPETSGGITVLAADGWGKRADRDYDNILWQSRDAELWTPADSDPFGYDVDPQIEAEVDGDRLKFKVPKSAVFKRPSGKAKLDEAAAAGDNTVVLTNTAYLKRGDTLNIGGVVRTIANDWEKGDEKVKLTTTLGTAKAKGTEVTWTVPAGPKTWATGLVWWIPGVRPKKISFKIRKPAGGNRAYRLQLRGATGPSGATSLIQEWGLGPNGPTNVSVALSGLDDLLMLQVVRDTEDKSPAKFVCNVDDLKVSDLATADDYTANQVFKDLFTRMGAGTGGVAASTQNVMPLHLQEASLGMLADEVASLVNWHWGIYANDQGDKRGEAAPWGTKQWTVTIPELPVQMIPQERFNVVSIDYTYAGGVTRTMRVRANPDPLPQWTNVYRLDLDDPPRKDIAEAFAQAIANYLAEMRWSGEATITTATGPSGEVSAVEIEPGDTLILTNNNNRKVRVQSVAHDPSGEFVRVTFASGHPLLDRILARRKRRLTIGWSNAKATLSGLGLERPAAPATTLVGFKEAEARGGRRKFHAVVDWTAVETDVNEQAHAMRQYIVQARPVDAAGVPIPEADGGGIREQRTSAKDDNDGAGDPHIPTKAIFKNLEHPHKWRWEFRVRAVSVLGQKGAWTTWSTPTKPAAFGPPQPTNLTMRLHPRADRINIDWDAPDLTETDNEGRAILDRRIAYFEVKLFRRLKGTSNAWELVKGPKKIGRKTEHAFRGIDRIGRYRWRAEVQSVDHYGNTSGW